MGEREVGVCDPFEAKSFYRKFFLLQLFHTLSDDRQTLFESAKVEKLRRGFHHQKISQLSTNLNNDKKQQ